MKLAARTFLKRKEVQKMQFRQQYAFLSNFYTCRITIGSLVYTNAEAAFQAQKNTDYAHQFVNLTGAQAKRLGRKIPIDIRDWNQRRNQVMLNVIRAKFSQNPRLAKLLAQVDAPIVEENTWGDTYWGVCRGKGYNHLGKILEQMKSELAN